MDIFTQGVIGATLAQSAAKKEHLRTASFVGLFSGVLADADILIKSSTDPLLTLEYHRHFTHSIFFIPIGALIAFILLWPFLRKRLPARYLYLYCFMGFLLSGFIDACTSYGTHLFWPLMDERISWHFIPIIEPIFTVCLLIGIIISFKTLRPVFARAGLLFAACYLVFALFQLQRAEQSIYELAEQRNHQIEMMMVKPTIGNTILWRSVYLSGEQFYIDAVRVGINKHIYTGTSIERFDLNKAFPNIDKNTTLYNDIKRFEYFSDGYVSFYPDKSNILGDTRYSISPLSTIPLWGIEIDMDEPEQHVKYEFYRASSKEVRQQFMDMLLGKN